MKLSANFYTNPLGTSQTMTTKEAKKILLETEGWTFALGECYDIKVKNLGCGVKRITLKKKPL